MSGSSRDPHRVLLLVRDRRAFGSKTLLLLNQFHSESVQCPQLCLGEKGEGELLEVMGTAEDVPAHSTRRIALCQR